MRLSETMNLPLPTDGVAEMYADPGYAEVRAQTLHARSGRAEVSGEASGEFTVSTTLELTTQGIPDIARPFVGQSVRITEVQTWEAPAEGGARQGTIELKVEGTPASMSGHLELRPDGDDASVVRIDGELTAKVPLVGGRLEKAAKPYVTKVLHAEERSAKSYRDAGSA
ncbi:DUF2505 domain-containing protein [Brachybacterium endophyticum]|uniref:DUF2505 domain-containing protein n=1 Tax=Brachybacterium endophyticum TaxID=2182385 RepID=A0A2U2RH42_9MICO|nr:DUF2505 domain-containing protein [Brachybacterium endophyticum]PWH05170.1 DUF2505 domain-containing protein [Brachybacterium endophyticum]